MKIVIWGAGDMGQRVISYLGTDNVVAYIDSDIEKVGTLYKGISVISIDEYIEKYNKFPILISALDCEEIEVVLKEKDITFYYKLSECPSEFSNVEYSSILEDFCMNQIAEDTEYVIYGESLFTIVLNEWIKKNKGYYLPIVLPKSGDKRLFENVRVVNPQMDFLLEKEGRNNRGVNYLVTDEWYIKDLIDKGVDPERIINLYDISDREESYYHAEIKQYKDIYKGETCFIIGHGPSLQTRDLDVLEENHVITFSMNWTFKLFDKTEWRPDYYVVTDRKMIDSYSYFKWDEYTKRKCFIADISEKFWKENQSPNNVKYHSIRNMNIRETKFSDDISRRIYYGSTVVYDCLQIAAYMGFEKIYLLGMDLVPYKEGDKSAYQYSNFYQQDDSSKSPQMWVDIILRAYQAAKEYADIHNIQIYNATRGGYLEIFDRVNFDELFG